MAVKAIQKTYMCDSPADGGRGSVERERDKQASGAETAPTEQPLQGSLDHPTGSLSCFTEPADLPPPPDTQHASEAGLTGRWH